MLRIVSVRGHHHQHLSLRGGALLPRPRRLGDRLVRDLDRRGDQRPRRRGLRHRARRRPGALPHREHLALGAIKAAQFLFVCEDTRPDCFALGADRLPERSIAAPPPLYIRDIVPSGGPDSLVLTATLVPASILDVTLTPKDPAAPVTFRSVPSGDAPQDVLFLPAGDLVALFLKHYFRLLILAFFATGAMLVLLVLLNAIDFVASFFRRGPTDVAPSKHHVTLRLDDGGAP